MKSICLSMIAALLLCAATVQAQSMRASTSYSSSSSSSRTLLNSENYIQGLIGGMQFSSDSYTLRGTDALQYSGEMPSMPFLGGMWQTGLLGGERVSLGVEAGILFGFINDSVAFSAGGSGLTVYVRNQFFVLDTMLGANLNMNLGERLRLYAGAGPVFMFSHLDLENKSDDATAQVIEDTTASGHDLGFYGRLGLELSIREGSFLGFQARYVDAELDFENSIGSLDMSGVQYMLTFTEDF